MPDKTCLHINAIDKIKHAKRRQCDECVKSGARWVHLRTCQECGATHCCDDSTNRHATAPAHGSKHPVIASAEPGERWLYCFPTTLLRNIEKYMGDAFKTAVTRP